MVGMCGIFVNLAWTKYPNFSQGFSEGLQKIELSLQKWLERVSTIHKIILNFAAAAVIVEKTVCFDPIQ